MNKSEINFDKLIIIGDRILIKPRAQEDRTDSGLYLPQGIVEKEKIRTGYVIKVGPGYPIPMPSEDVEPWKENTDPTKYIPLQAKEGDLAIFLQKSAYELIYEGEKFFIVGQNAILMLERDEDLFN